MLTLLTDTLSPDTVIETVLAAALDITGATAASLYQFWDEAKLAFVSSLGLARTQTNCPNRCWFRREPNSRPISSRS